MLESVISYTDPDLNKVYQQYISQRTSTLSNSNT